jgi:hypothetical protein
MLKVILLCGFVSYIIKTTTFISAVYFLAVKHLLSLKPNSYISLSDVKFLKNIFFTDVR